MSKSATTPPDVVDHREHADWVAISQSPSSSRRIHRIKGDPDQEEIQNEAAIEAACSTTLIGTDSDWKPKPAAVFPVGYHPLCTEEECFGPVVDGDVDGQ